MERYGPNCKAHLNEYNITKLAHAVHVPFYSTNHPFLPSSQ